VRVRHVWWALLIFAACGGEPAQPAVDDKTIAQRAALRLEDFPPGWEQGDSNAKRTEPPGCPTVAAARDAASGRHQTPDFDSVKYSKVNSVVLVFRDEAKARDAYRGLAGQATSDCIVEGLGAGDLATGKVRAAPVTLAAVGDERSGVRVELPVESGKLVIEFAYVRAGRGVVTVLFVNADAPLDERFRDDLTGKVARRLGELVKT
jgi:hypothetical protein